MNDDLPNWGCRLTPEDVDYYPPSGGDKVTCTTDYGNTYKFSIERRKDWNPDIRIYIDQQPSYGSRDTDPHKIHRNRDGNRYYICVKEESQPRTVSEAKAIAGEWVKRTDRYVRSGVSFEAPGRTQVRAYTASF